MTWQEFKDSLLSRDSFLEMQDRGFNRTPFLCITSRPFAPTKKFLKIRNSFGHTMLHYAAVGGWLKEIPIELLTPELLSMTNNYGETPLHWVKDFSTVPAEIITQEHMHVPDKNGIAPINNLFNYLSRENFDALPDSFVSQNGEWFAKILRRRGEQDMLLGRKLPQSARPITGETWWQENGIKLFEIEKQKAVLTVEPDSSHHEISLF